MDFVAGIDFVGDRFTEVGASKFRRKLRKGLARAARHAFVPPGMPSPFDLVEGVDFIGDQYTDVGASKLRQRLRRGLARVAKRAVVPPGMPSPFDFVEGIDFVGDEFTEVGAGKFARALKKGVKMVGKVVQPLTKMAAKIVPAPYNIAFSAAAKLNSKVLGALDKKKGKKAVLGLAKLAQAGDKKAAATLAALKLTKDANQGRPEGMAQFVAQSQAKKATRVQHARVKGAVAQALTDPAVAALPREERIEVAKQAASDALSFQVTTPSGKTFAIHL